MSASDPSSPAPETQSPPQVQSQVQSQSVAQAQAQHTRAVDALAAIHPTRGSWTRIQALVLRYVYLLRGSGPRLFELFYWPTVQILLWGFFSLFLQTQEGYFANAVGLLIAAVLFWDLLFRAQLGVSMVFLEEMWSRNLGHLFVSPLRPWEWVTGLLLISVLRSLIGLAPAAVLAALFFDFQPLSLGLGFVAFFFNMVVMGWAIALGIIALILRLGAGAEGLAWMSVFLLAPISCIYYPVEALPGWLQPVALALPSTHTFEGMRGVLIDGVFSWGHLGAALGLNALYLVLGTWVFWKGFQAARQTGRLFQQGE